MDQRYVFIILVGMMAVTYIPRLLPALFLSSRTLHPAVERWLSYVPTAVLAALLAPSLLVRDGSLDFGMENVGLWAALPCLILAWRTRSFFGTVALGMVLVAAARYFGLAQ